MANANGTNLKVVGSADMKKQEKKTSDTRVSITAFRIGTGSTAGNNGTTGFLMKGERRKTGFDDQ